jgi:cytochrome c5
MRIWKLAASCVFLGAGLVLTLQTPGLAAAPAAPSGKQSKNGSTQTVSPSEGERVFKQNCSRCHQAPESFSPLISGTIVRHMRVRASLSRDDERAILKFLNP